MEYYTLNLLNPSPFDTRPNGDELLLFDIPAPTLFGGVHAPRSSESPQQGVSRAELSQILTNALSSLKVYVVESDITDAQNSIKAVVEQSTF